MEILVATTNRHKIAELESLFPGHCLLSAVDAGFPGFDVEEDGSTYLENAVKKASVLHGLAGRAVLADDSGLAVVALGGEPGIHSARFGSSDGRTKLDTPQRNALLLSIMDKEEDRRCAFVCCLVLMFSPERFFVVQETCEGLLLRAARGEGGFGYDPVVFLPDHGKSVAELGAGIKNRISHRGKAAARMAAILDSL